MCDYALSIYDGNKNTSWAYKNIDTWNDSCTTENDRVNVSLDGSAGYSTSIIPKEDKPDNADSYDDPATVVKKDQIRSTHVIDLDDAQRALLDDIKVHKNCTIIMNKNGLLLD